ncbi:MAG TPA: sigma-70 family RNA polymerase sigma factor [Rhabdaerophilum sp.]|nr:sigma-70 family RNA polymerase sigma factor [Rhabdaerophilum sp.]
MPPADHWANLMRAVAEEQDRTAFTTIFDHFTPRLETFLRRMGLDADAAEEVSQDVMVTLWRKAALFDPEKSTLSTWLYRIARNRRIDLVRRNRSIAVDPHSTLLTTGIDDAGADLILEESQRDDIVRTLIASLPEEQRGLVVLAFYSGLSHSDIAARESLPLGTVKSRLRLAFQRLKRGLEANGIESLR